METTVIACVMDSPALRKRVREAEAIPPQAEPPRPEAAGSEGRRELLSRAKEKAQQIIGRQAAGRHSFSFQVVFVVLLTLTSFATRFYKISAGNFVLWDEAHFGKFGSYYLRRMFYFDVHPPLGKMLVAGAQWLAGFDGTWEFPSGKDYPENVNYSLMRMLVASFGCLAVPLTYMTAKKLRLSSVAAYIVAAMTLLDVGLIGITRLILLDSMLLLFTISTTFFYVGFRDNETRPFTRPWFAWLCACGVSIGCVSSVKWVGFFVTALVGFGTINELWMMLGDRSLPKSTFMRHFAARAFGLIAIPIAVYVASFYVHFAILNKTGPGDANMSSLFQAGLEGNALHKSPIDVAYGSMVTVKNGNYGGGLLHSHLQLYPSGSKQQQVTTYHHKDYNNEWIFVRNYTADPVDPSAPPQLIKDGDILRIKHNFTERFLHSHYISAPVTKMDLEVSGYGGDEHNDPNDLWRIEIVKDSNAGPLKTLRALSTKFRLRHHITGCYLKARNARLPEWGFMQGEVSCDRQSSLNAPYLLWNVESHHNDQLPEGNSAMYKSRFWDNFVDVNVGMWLTNNALVPDPSLEPSPLTSEARHWPLMLRGIRMSGWDDDRLKFFMLGNPIVWWYGFASFVATIGTLCVYILMRHRRALRMSQAEWETFTYRVKITSGGWLLHFMPFFLMGRVLYLHHYYPTLLFAILNGGFVFDHFLGNKPSKVQWWIGGTLIALVAATFLYFSPIAYGITGPSELFGGRNWISSWSLVQPMAKVVAANTTLGASASA